MGLVSPQQFCTCQDPGAPPPEFDPRTPLKWYVGLIVAQTSLDVAVELWDKNKTGSQYVVRGGENALDSVMRAGILGANGALYQVSAQSYPDVSPNILGSYLPNKKIGVSTLGQVEAAGGVVLYTPSVYNPYHVDINGLTAVQINVLFGRSPNPFPNPYPRPRS